MNLIIDIGNTFTKIAIGNTSKLMHTFVYPSININLLNDLKHIFPETKYCIISNVAHVNKNIIEWLKQNYLLLNFNHNTPIPIKNQYQTPETLGLDRLSCAVGSNSLLPRNNILSIDAGTCIKFDFISSEAIYYGGGISPGLQMRLRALNNFTARLPLIEYKDEKIELIGNSTEKSILSGVINGIIAEINGIIEMYQNEYKDLKVILTGGDASYFEKKIKYMIFAQPNLVAIGLNEILNYNIINNQI